MLKHLDYLDGWRGLAIGCVLVDHFARIPGFAAGRLGVDLFFALSGLLMSRILFEERIAIGTFYRRRVARIVPVFFLYLAVIFTIHLAVGDSVSLHEVLASATFLRTYVDPFIWDSQFPIGHLWSLNVEEHSYMLLALIAGVGMLQRRSSAMLLGLGLATFGAMAVYVLFTDLPTREWMLRSECAATTILISAWYRRVCHRVPVKPWMPALVLALVMASYVQVFPKEIRAVVAPFMLAFAVNHLGAMSAWLLAIFRNAGLRYLGLWSYSIYLWQQPFHESKTLPDAVAFVLAILTGIASYYLFETPVRRWLNQNWKSGREARSSAYRADEPPAQDAAR
ncbi:MAG: acyltransferase family protein [Povalibacter sp.]